MKVLLILLILTTTVEANNKIIIKGYTNEQICNAIYKAEGGSKAQFPYGIRSVKCESKEACRKVCLNTIRNNRKRFEKDASFGKITFIEFLGSRFCPTKGKLSNAENRLNKNWVKNVNYFLRKDNS